MVVVPSYNNEQWVQRCLESVFLQDYSNYRMVYIDDCSTDATADLVQEYIDKNQLQNKALVIKNKERMFKLYNLYHAIHNYCADDEIVVELDGDDWFGDSRLFKKINAIYTNGNVWMTYGNFRDWPDRPDEETALRPREIPKDILDRRAFREFEKGCIQTALRTFYAGLFKLIKEEDLKYEGKFYPRTSDTAIMLPMFEMAGTRFKYIKEKVYIHNLATPLNDHKVDPHFQVFIDRYVRSLPHYAELPNNHRWEKND